MKERNNRDTTVLQYAQWIAIFVLSIALVILGFIFKDQLSQLHTLGLLGIFLANLLGSIVPFVPVPGIITVVTGGMLYEPTFVALLATFGAVIGDTMGYFIGLSGEKLLLRKEYAYHEKLVKLMKRYGAFVIFLFGFIPNPLFDAVGIIAGILNYPLKKFVLWLFLGRLIRNLILAFFSAQFL